jgi:ribose transport system ATP-binding protein
MSINTETVSGAPRAPETAPFAVRIEGLSKTFPGQRALDHISLEIRKGEIHALVGQNGSGKSTLIKILSGFHQPDPGASAWLLGEEAELGNLTEGQRARLLFIHQDLALVPTLSVRENLGLERPGRGRGLRRIDKRHEREEAVRLLSAFELDIDPEALVGKLTPFEQSAVAIARALGAVREDACLLVLDEPTASLGAVEAQQLFATLRRVNAMGIAILYVSHILPEILSISDRISVLRDGRRVAQVDTASTTEDELVTLIVGGGIEKVAPPPAEEIEDEAWLRLVAVEADGLNGVSLSVRRGEVVGLVGLVGSGHEKIAQLLAGDRAWHGGHLEICGTEYEELSPATAAHAGLTAMPADRRGTGLIPHFTVAENVVLPAAGRNFRHGRFDRRAEDRDVRHWIGITEVMPPDPSRLVQELSGGNQQKVMLAKALRLDPKVLVLAEPTQAVDVGAAATIRRLITQLAEDGRAILVSSSDAEELCQICHRVLITRNGRIACELVGEAITEDRILFESQFEGAAVA